MDHVTRNALAARKNEAEGLGKVNRILTRIINYIPYEMGGGTPHMKGVGMLIGNFESNP